tara:strand:+ start:3663 stop:5021 length:1359 start_codon:yes stop_codon:yes gene_type:complete
MKMQSLKIILNLKNISLLIFIFHFTISTTQAQQIVEGVVAVVGDKAIFKSEIEQQYLQLKKIENQSKNIKCDILNDLIFQKLLSHHAELDSLEVTDDEVNDAINQRIEYFISQIGSEKKMEQYFDKSISQIKDEFQSIFREQRLSQKMENKITSNLNVTPQDVLKFYNKIHKDSLPIFAEEIYLSQLVVFPKIDKLERDRIISKLNILKQRINNGEDFSFLASLYSDDTGSSKNGGDLGFVRKGVLVPEFESVAFRLQDEELSDIIETKFGFHLIQMISRRGQEFNVRHILLKPNISPKSIENAKVKLDSIVNLMLLDSVSFDQLAIKYSEDDSRNNGGRIVNKQTGSSSFVLDELEFSISSTINGLKENEYSKPTIFTSDDGRKACRVIYIDRIIEEHKANLKEDYDRIQSVALQEKKVRVLNNWKKDKLNETYIDIKVDYDCEISDYLKN